MYGFKLNTAMDKLREQAHSEGLKKTLNCYQLSSIDSLSGPSGYPARAAQLWCKGNDHSLPNPPPPLIQIPLLMPNDTSTKRAEALLGGEMISCFIVGGEKRLCLPQILKTVLRDFSLSEINRTCAELHIYCSRCSPDQLEILKVLGILPCNTTQCGLITKTDAERLVSALGVEYHLNAKHDVNTDWGKSKGIKVYHECFGRGYGYFYPDLYSAPDAPCIACMDCRITLSPSRFVSHSHRGLEKRTCHWGFDPENWRNYILLPDDTEASQRKKLEKQLDALKSKFEPANSSSGSRAVTSSPLKRRLTPDSKVEHGKRLKENKSDEREFVSSAALPQMCLGFPYGIRPSAFKPFAGFPLAMPPFADLSAVQGDAFLKAYAPMMQDRRLLPGYVQFGPPAVIPTHNATVADWSAALRNAPLPPNITLAPPEQQKRTASYIMEQERKKDVARARSNSGGSHDGKSFKPMTTHLKTEVVENVKSFYPDPHRSSSPPTQRSRRTSENGNRCPSRKIQTASGRSITDPISLKKKFMRNEFRRQSSDDVQEQPHNLSNGHRRIRSQDKENEVDAVSNAHDPSDKSRMLKTEEGAPPLLAMRNAVVAASAMLELSSSGKEPQKNHHPHASSNHSSSPRDPDASGKPESHRKSSSELSNGPYSVPKYPIITTRDHNYYKWTFPTGSYIISLNGSQELKAFESLLVEGVKDDALIQQIILEVVKMKARYEERLDLRTREQRDTERELESVKATKNKCLEDAAIARQERKKEIEQLRNEHSVREKEADELLIELGRQVAELRMRPNDHERELVLQKVLDRLHQEIDEKLETTRRLEKQLRDEREKRAIAEKKLDDVMDETRGRFSLLMDGALPSMMRNLRKAQSDSPERLVPPAYHEKEIESSSLLLNSHSKPPHFSPPTSRVVSSS